jgi:formate dehydrogenase subunit delta
MANAIATFFEAEPQHDDVIAGVAGHLERFWDPRMRRDLLSWIDHHGGDGLHSSVLEAVASRRAAWRDAGIEPAGG